MPHNIKLKDIKSNISNILANLQFFESQCNVASHESASQTTKLQENTSTILTQLEALQCKRIVAERAKRKRKRLKTKEKAKRQKQVERATSQKSRSSKGNRIEPEPYIQSIPVPEKNAQHIALKKLHDAKNILNTLNLIERLYKARGGQENLEHRLSRMRTVWRRVKEENDNSISNLESPVHLWNATFFGSSSQTKVPQEENMKEFLQRRYVWDSYISHGKNASGLPIGWVLPTDKPLADWSQYQCQ